MRIDVITLFPDMFNAITHHGGVAARALKRGIWSFHLWNPRQFTHDRYRRIDDRPFGGGPGMVMLPGPLDAAVSAARQHQRSAGLEQSHVVYVSPQGARLTHTALLELAKRPALIVLCGRYEGVDERLIEHQVDEEISIGDYVLSGGELPAMVLIDALVRWLPGVLNDTRCASEDSFAAGLLDYPHYTRPQEYEGMLVPEVLLSGDHARIAAWRLKQSLGRTWLRRPDLLIGRTLTKQASGLLTQFQQEQDPSSLKASDESH